MCETFEHIELGDVARGFVLLLLAGHEDEYAPLINYFSALDSMQPVPGRLSREECFVLHNGAQVSYGDILGLAGDFYLDFDSLDNAVLQPDNQNVKTKQDEVHNILVAAHHDIDHTKLTAAQHTEDVMSKDPGEKWIFAKAGLPLGRSTALAKKNDTHFPPDGFLAWQHFHEIAIAVARQGRADAKAGKTVDGAHLDPTLRNFPALQKPLFNGLVQALKICAFGDHFLTDMFSSGHMRTPRARLRKDYDAGKPVTVSDILSRLQHQEDGNHGLFCTFLMGPGQLVDGKKIDQWYAMGDKQFADPRNAQNQAICIAAVKRSIRDLVLASLTGKYPTQTEGYWGADPEPHASHAALQLMPKPLPPSDNYVASYSEREGAALNSHPIAMPKDGLDKRIDGFVQLLKARDKSYVDGELLFRKQLTTPLGGKSAPDGYMDLAAKLKQIGGGEIEYLTLVKVLYQHGNDYQPEGA